MAEVLNREEVSLKVLEEVRRQALKIIEEAQRDAEKIIGEAKKQAEEIARLHLTLDEEELEKAEAEKLEKEVEELRAELSKKLDDFMRRLEENRELIIKELVEAILGLGEES